MCVCVYMHTCKRETGESVFWPCLFGFCFLLGHLFVREPLHLGMFPCYSQGPLTRVTSQTSFTKSKELKGKMKKLIAQGSSSIFPTCPSI